MRFLRQGYNKLTVNFLLFLSLLFFLTIVSQFFLFPKGTIVSEVDVVFNIKRMLSITTAIDDGLFPFFIDSQSLDGYGYGTHLFYPDIMLVPFALLVGIFNPVTAYIILLCSFTLVCGIIMYISVRKIFKSDMVAGLASLLYTFGLYRINAMASNGALGEYLAFTFVPLVFWGVYEIIAGDYTRKWYILSVGFACLVLTHLISTFLCALLLVFILLFFSKRLIKEPKRIVYLIISAIVAVLLSALFLFPMLEQMTDNTFYYKSAPLAQGIGALPPMWALIGVFLGFTDQTYLSGIGLLIMFPLISRIFVSESNKWIKFADVSVIAGFILFAATTSLFPWNSSLFKFMPPIQFTWRFYVFLYFIFAYSGAIYFNALISRRTQVYMLYALICSLIVLQSYFIGVKTQKKIPINEFCANKTADFDTYIIGGGTEYLPSAVPSLDFIKERGRVIETKNPATTVSNIKNEKSVLSFNITTGKTEKTVLPLIYYKGYKAEVDGEQIDIRESGKGLVEVDIPRSGHVKVWYYGTFIQKLSLFISVATLIGLLLFIFMNRRKHGGREKNDHAASDI